MSINAGVELLAPIPLQDPSPGFVNGGWTNIKLRIRYPYGQSFSSNPPEVNDIIVDPGGNVWKIRAITNTVPSTNIIFCTVVQEDGPSEVGPELGTNYGVILTPSLGGLDPWWESSLVSNAVARKAMTYGIKAITSVVPFQHDIDIQVAIVGDAPENLNSLEKLGNAIGNDPNFDITINDKINAIETNKRYLQTVKADPILDYNIVPFDQVLVNTIIDTWEAGKTYYIFSKIFYNSNYYICLITHDTESDKNFTDYESCWKIFNPILEWNQSRNYLTNEVVKYNGHYYIALIDNVNTIPASDDFSLYIQNLITPDISFSNKWRLVPTWKEHTSYSNHSIVVHDDIVYFCKNGYVSGEEFNLLDHVIINEWSPTTIYSRNDRVIYEGQIYSCKKGTVTGDEFSLTNWELFPEWDNYHYYRFGELVAYNGIIYRCKTNLVNTDRFIKEQWLEIPNWEPDKPYHINDFVSYDGKVYQCNQGFISAASFTQTESTNWSLYSQWDINKKYKFNDLVSHEGILYKCVSGLISENIFNTSKWTVIPSWVANHGYAEGDYVLYNSRVYKATVTFTSTSSFDLTKFVEITNIESWIANKTYIGGDLVVYNNVKYFCSAYLTGIQFYGNNLHPTSYDWKVYFIPDQWVANKNYIYGDIVVNNVVNIYFCTGGYKSDNYFNSSDWNLVSDILVWKLNGYYIKDEIVKCDDKFYICADSFRSLSVFNSTEQSNWEAVYTPPAWEANHTYTTDNLVNYQNKIYKTSYTFYGTETFNEEKWTEVLPFQTSYSGYYIGDYVVYKQNPASQTSPNAVWKCNAGFVPTTFDSSDWSIYAKWTIGNSYRNNDIVTYGNKFYKCIGGRIVSSWNTDEWDLIYPYQTNTGYIAGQFVKYSNAIYSAKQNFTSGSTFDVNQWTLITETPNFAAGSSYRKKDVVKYTDNNYYSFNAGFIATNFSTELAANVWTVIETVDNFTIGKNYILNSKVYYSVTGGIYKCISPLAFVTTSTFNSNDWILSYTTDDVWISRHKYYLKEVIYNTSLSKFYECIDGYLQSTFILDDWALNSYSNWEKNTSYTTSSVVLYGKTFYRTYKTFMTVTFFNKDDWNYYSLQNVILPNDPLIGDKVIIVDYDSNAKNVNIDVRSNFYIDKYDNKTNNFTFTDTGKGIELTYSNFEKGWIISETINLADNFLTLNNHYTSSNPYENGGFGIERGKLSNASLLWDETSDRWKAGFFGAERKVVLEADTIYGGDFDAIYDLPNEIEVINLTNRNLVINNSGNIAGIEIERGLSPSASLIWDEATDTWKIGIKGSEKTVLTSDSISDTIIDGGTF